MITGEGTRQTGRRRGEQCCLRLPPALKALKKNNDFFPPNLLQHSGTDNHWEVFAKKKMEEEYPHVLLKTLTSTERGRSCSLNAQLLRTAGCQMSDGKS